MGKLGWFMSRTQTLTSPPREGEPAGTTMKTSAQWCRVDTSYFTRNCMGDSWRPGTSYSFPYRSKGPAHCPRLQATIIVSDKKKLTQNLEFAEIKGLVAVCPGKADLPSVNDTGSTRHWLASAGHGRHCSTLLIVHCDCEGVQAVEDCRHSTKWM